MSDELPAPDDDDGWRQRYPTDALSRRAKAAKIVAVVGARTAWEGSDVCEVGTGSGHMTAVFMDAVGDRGSVRSLDIVDTREERPGSDFRLIEGPTFPLDADSCDIVVSNHVIEHVGEYRDQFVHLTEIRRVLRPDGVAYLSTPNRWAPVENHFRLPFLSWIPRGLRDSYVRATGRGSVFDVLPLAPSELDMLCEAAGFDEEEVTALALDETIRHEPDSKVSKVLSTLPVHRHVPLGRLMPTQVRMLRSASR